MHIEEKERRRKRKKKKKKKVSVNNGQLWSGPPPRVEYASRLDQKSSKAPYEMNMTIDKSNITVMYLSILLKGGLKVRIYIIQHREAFSGNLCRKKLVSQSQTQKVSPKCKILGKMDSF